MLRLLIAGIPEEKIKITEHEVDSAQLLDLNGIKNIFVFFEMYVDQFKEPLKEKIKEMMKNAD